MKRLLMALVVAVMAALATTTPALAAQSGHLCMTYGSYCAGANKIADGYDIIGQSTGRSLQWVGDGGTYEGYPTGIIQFQNATSECVDDPTTGVYLYVDPCSGVNGVVWAKVDLGSGNWRFINRYQSGRYGTDMYMTAVNTSGAHWKLDCRTSGGPCTSGEDQTFYWTG